MRSVRRCESTLRGVHPGAGVLAAIVALCLLPVVPGCGGSATPGEQRATPLAPDLMPREPAAWGSDAELLGKLQASAHNYFRFVSAPFNQEVCRVFLAEADAWPSVLLHGDAHVEQYAVTSRGRGLGDFDESTEGPAPIDLLRFATSLVLASRAHGWQPPLDDFFGGYAYGLAGQVQMPSEPAVARRLRGHFRSDHQQALAKAEAMMEETVDLQVASHLLRGYVDRMGQRRPDLPVEYFRVKRAGLLKMGIGSATVQKLLVRAEGATPAASDDLLIEAKEVRNGSGVQCIRARSPATILRGQARISYNPYEFGGHCQADADAAGTSAVFWVHEWEDDYAELSIEDALREPEELAQVAYDVGVQLALGHTRTSDGGRDGALRGRLSQALQQHRGELIRAANALADATTLGWQSLPGQ